MHLRDIDSYFGFIDRESVIISDCSVLCYLRLVYVGYGRTEDVMYNTPIGRLVDVTSEGEYCQTLCWMLRSRAVHTLCVRLDQ